MPTVHIKQGALEGDSHNGCYCFLGIPYAAPPVGPLRWQPPAPPAAWEGVRQATAFGPSAIQTINTGLPPEVITSEDCLYLNVWTKCLDLSVLQPTMVWIHGGGFLNGSSSMPDYLGSDLARHDVTVVTLNYRLGAFGFLRHPDAGDNFGLLDWVAALTWVSHNIHVFGGNPNNVTIFGQSSGAVAVRSLLSTPAARGLFHRGIIQSSGFEPYVAAPNPSLERVIAASEKVFAALGSNDIDVLRAVPAEIVRVAAFQASGLNPPQGELHTPANLQWYPVYDGKTMTEDFAGWDADVPILFGVTADEMRGFYRPNTIYGHPHLSAAEAYTTQTLERMTHILAGKRAEAVMAVYTASGMTPYEALADLGTIAIWSEPALATYRRFAALQDRKSYFYRFARVSPAAHRSGLRAMHTGELPYIFGPMTRQTRWQPWGTPRAPPSADGAASSDSCDYDSVDERVSALMQEAWVEFARTGVPSSNGKAWPHCTVSTPQYTVIKDKVEWKDLEATPVEVLLSELRERRHK
ncbi:Carboxylesterase [Xylogone sp. PMI_703]|nr:Carboxylesterase [Xylogone sp. PMI_703]